MHGTIFELNCNMKLIKITNLILALFIISNNLKSQEDSSRVMNQKVIEIVEKYGPSISPTYETAVCTELVIGVLEHLIELDSTDKSRIRIIIVDDVCTLCVFFLSSFLFVFKIWSYKRLIE